MSNKKDSVLSQYAYELPSELIAQNPAEPRDSSRLFVYDTKTDTISFDVFRNIGKYIPKDSLLVLNDTQVIPARVILSKETGGKVELLFLANEYRGGKIISAISNKKLIIGQILSFNESDKIKVIAQEENIFVFEILFDAALLPALLSNLGLTPTPPYIDSYTGGEGDLRVRYQSVFAEKPASVAAPTASLHFTPELLTDLEKNGIESANVTLHVGMGTFAPVRSEQVASGILHTEFFDVSELSSQKIAKQKKEGRPVVAVGTTVVRTLESAAKDIISGKASGGPTSIFIRPPYSFQIPNILVTNFHVPESSLLCLIDAFLVDKKASRNILDLYSVAIAERFRFFSFGDAMLIL